MATYTIEIADTDLLALNNDLLDVDTWIQGAVTGKINSCKKRMINEWQPVLFNDTAVTSIPATQDEFITAVVARDDYKNRADKEAMVAEMNPTEEAE
jgi:hypothetical protein